MLTGMIQFFVVHKVDLISIFKFMCGVLITDTRSLSDADDAEDKFILCILIHLLKAIKLILSI